MLARARGFVCAHIAPKPAYLQDKHGSGRTIRTTQIWLITSESDRASAGARASLARRRGHGSQGLPKNESWTLEDASARAPRSKPLNPSHVTPWA